MITDGGSTAKLGTYLYFSPCIVGLITEDERGDSGVGTAFHVGDGYLVTARHVIENRRIVDLVTRQATLSVESIKPIYPTDPNIDIAILQTDFSLDSYKTKTRIIMGGEEVEKTDHLELGGHLDDWIDDGLVLLPVTVFGFPPIPLSREPVLVAARGEVNAIIDPYTGSPHPLFIISPLARGGFSGGPVLLGDSYVLGVATSSLVHNEAAAESGFHAALTVEPVWDLLFENGIVPTGNGDLMYELRDAWPHIKLDWTTQEGCAGN